jgi:hypothetical protein
MGTCQRCKSAPSTSSLSIGSLAAPGSTEKVSRGFRLCAACHGQFRSGPDSGDRCARCGGPGGDGCGIGAIEDGKRLCLDCWWPTHLTDAPVKVERVIDTIEQKWLEAQAFFQAMQNAIDSGQLAGDRLTELRQGLRIHAAQLVADSQRLNAGLPSEAEALVRRHLGNPPYPSFADIVAEMQQNAKESAQIDRVITPDS